MDSRNYLYSSITTGLFFNITDKSKARDFASSASLALDYLLRSRNLLVSFVLSLLEKLLRFCGLGKTRRCS